MLKPLQNVAGGDSYPESRVTADSEEALFHSHQGDAELKSLPNGSIISSLLHNFPVPLLS